MSARAKRNVLRMTSQPRNRDNSAWFGKFLTGVETEYEYSLDHGNTWCETTASGAHHQSTFYGRPVRSREVTPWQRMPRPASSTGSDQP